MVKTPSFSAVCVHLIPHQRTKILHASQSKNQNRKQKQYCNKFNKDFKNCPHSRKLEIINIKYISYNNTYKLMRVSSPITQCPREIKEKTHKIKPCI